MNKLRCVYCNREIVSKSARVRLVYGDPDGITAIHYEQLPNRYIPCHFETEDGVACAFCLKEGKELKKGKVEKGESSDLKSEMRLRRDERKAEKEKAEKEAQN